MTGRWLRSPHNLHALCMYVCTAHTRFPLSIDDQSICHSRHVVKPSYSQSMANQIPQPWIMSTFGIAKMANLAALLPTTTSLYLPNMLAEALSHFK